MSKQNPPTGAPEQRQEYSRQPIELERSEEGDHQLRWVVVENPDQAFHLREDDYVLDSYFDPEFDAWEVLIRLEPERSAE